MTLTGADDCLVLGATTTADADIDDQAQGVSITASDDHGVEDSDHAEFTVSLDTGDVAEQAYVVSYSITWLCQQWHGLCDHRGHGDDSAGCF